MALWERLRNVASFEEGVAVVTGFELSKDLGHFHSVLLLLICILLYEFSVAAPALSLPDCWHDPCHDCDG